MEEKYYLYKGKLFSEGTLKEKYGDSVQDKINEYGFEEAYSYGDKVFSAGQLKEKYGDNYTEVISEKGITPYGVKKKRKTQPQEEVSTSDSQTPAQPSTESGASVEPQPIATISGGEITDLVEPYKVNDSAVTRDDLLNALKDEQFVESIRTGQTRLEIQDDQDLQDYANSIIQPPSEKKIDETLNRKSEGDDSVLDILGRSFQSGVTKLAADLYRTPEFIYDIAVDGYNQLLELQNKILPESLEARKIATSEELSEMTGIDNKYAENLEAYAQKKREINEKYQKPIFDNIKEGNYSEAALSTAMSVTESLPFMLSMMIPSVAGVKAASMFGGTTAVMGAGRKQELLEGDKELSETQMNTNALLYGMAEATDVLFGSGAVGRAIGDVVKKEGINKGKDFAADVVKNLVKERAYLAPFTEGLQESFTTYTQNVSDRITGVDTEKPLTEGVADAFIVGATMGAGSATVLQGAKYLSGKMKGKQSISNLNNITKNPEVFNEVTGQIDALVNTGELTEEEANTLKEDITNDVQVNASIPENIEGEDRAKAIELQKKYTETKINQEKASEPFKELYKPELESLSQQLQELATKKQQTTKGDITQEQFDKALEIIEPVASQRGELTLEQLDEVMSALGENASDVIDISQKKDAVDLYNELTDKKQEYAKETNEMREEGEQKATEEQGVGDMREGDKTEATQETKIENENIYISSGKKVKDFFEYWRRRLFSARRFLPKSVFYFKEKKEAMIAKQLNIMEQTLSDYRRELKKYDGDVSSLEENFDLFIRGKEVDLPDNFIKIGNAMRNQIDALSSELINEGLVKESQKETIKSNLGEYITRSYAVFDRANWKDEVQQEVVQKARNFLKGQMLKQAQDYKETSGDKRSVDEILDILVDQKIEELLNKDNASNFISGSRLGAKDVSVLKQRKDIPFEIRALLGEYTNPQLNYARTIQKMAALVANAKFLNEVKSKGDGVFLFKKNDINRPKEFNSIIAPEGSDVMNPLNGMYTTKEIAEEFNSPDSDLIDPKGGLGYVYRLYMGIIATVKWNKTIASLATHAKNIFGNIGFMFVNGHYKVDEMRKSYMTVKDDLLKLGDKELREKMNKYIELGIVKQSAGVGEIRDMFKDANFDDGLKERLSNKKMNKFERMRSAGYKTKKFLEDAYQAEDDFFKIVAYENEASRYSQALFGKDKSQLNEQEQKELDSRIAEIVKNTYPTYSRVPELIQFVRKFPFVGNFVSFQAEAWRTAYNTVELGMLEMKSDNPKIKKIGAQRMVGIMLYETLKDGIVGYFGMAAGTGLSGLYGMMFNSDDEDEKDADVRRYVAPWSKASDLWVLEANDGKLTYIDYSASDPHGGIRQVFNAFAEGKDTKDAFFNGLYQTIEPFLGEEIATEAFLNIRNNTNSYGGNIWNPEDTFNEQVEDIMAYLYKTFEFGTIKTVRGIAGADNKGRELVGAFLGLRTYEVDIKKQFGYKINDYKKKLKNARAIYNRAFYNEEKTEEEINEAYQRANTSINELIDELRKDYNSAMRLGVTEDDLYDLMSSKGSQLSKDEIISIEDNEKYELKQKTK